MFEFLFNHPIDIWEGARLSFMHTWPWWWLVLAFGLGLVCIFASLLRLRLSKFRRTVVGILQSCFLAIALFMLMQPVLLTDEMRREENGLAIVLDTSVSMGFSAEEQNGDSSQTRLSAAQEALNDLDTELSRSFDARAFTIGAEFNDAPAGVASQPAKPLSNTTNLACGLLELLDQASAGELAAVVLVSDGGNNAEPMNVEWWNRIRQANIPIHTVGVGPVTVANDFELAEVNLAGQAPPGTLVTAQLRIKHPSDASSVRLRVTSGDNLRYADTLALARDVTETVHQIEFLSGEQGVQAITFELQPATADAIPVNNRAQRVLQIGDKPKRILYVEGEPRWEYKFLRRSVAQNPNIEVVSLLRTSPNKFYRQGVVGPRELENGFPLTRAALFGYDAIIIGSLNAAELTIEQQANVRDFVAERGGALLMLGGSNGLSDGGWGRSAVQAALPTQLDAQAAGAALETFSRNRERVELTEFGQRAEWLHMPLPDAAASFDGEGSAQGANAQDDAWSSLPELANVQFVGEPRPGAQVLLQTTTSKLPLLTWHRYGKGRSYVLATSGTWRWQMSLPSEDLRHESFWQNLLSELTNDVTSRVSMDVGPAIQRDRENTLIEVQARDAEFNAYQGNELVATVIEPDGSESALVLQPDINRDGYFIGNLDYSSTGVHGLRVELPENNDGLEVNVNASAASDTTWWTVEANTAEYFSPELQENLLQRMASETGGSYRTLSTLAQLPNALINQNNALTRQVEWPIWNMPILFALLLLGKLLEWGLRLKWKRL